MGRARHSSEGRADRPPWQECASIDPPRGYRDRLLPRADLLVVTTMIPLLPITALNTGMMTHVLSVGPLHFVGVISYSIYLVHCPSSLSSTVLLQGSGARKAQSPQQIREKINQVDLDINIGRAFLR